MKEYCKHPFNSIQVQNTGEIYCCCCYWTDFYSFGNIFEQSFDEIWNGKRAKEFRRQFIENDYKYCKLDVCDPFLGEIKPDYTAEFPKKVEFSYDRNCNVRCIFCRNERNVEEEKYNREKEKRIEENFDRIFTPIIQKAEFVELNSAGELFASKHSMEIVRKIIKINPDITFGVISNGILFTEERTKELGLEDRLASVIISIHAATEDTYNKLVENGNFNSVMKNIKYLSELKKAKSKFNNLQLNFVVTSVNYKEMKPFINLAKSLDAKVFFINYHRQIDSDDLMNELDITQSSHPKYNDFVQYLNDDIFNDDCCILSDYFRELKPVKHGIKDKVLNLFKK